MRVIPECLIIVRLLIKEGLTNIDIFPKIQGVIIWD